MAKRQARQLKALYFDLHIKSLEQYYSQTNPKGAYLKIKAFLLRHNFSHEQYPAIILNTRPQTWKSLISFVK